MIILHIAKISDYKFSGVNIVVPQHIKSQSKYAKVGFININNMAIEGIDNQFNYEKQFKISKLPEPFNKPDIVVFHECYQIEYISIYKELINNNIPYIIAPHGELTKSAQSSKRLKKVAANILLFNRFINNSKSLQCLSENELINTNYKVPKFIGTNGVNIPTKEKNSFNKNKTLITYIGRLDIYHKGLDLLIEAVSYIKNELKNNNCLIEIYGPDLKGRYENVKRLIEEHNLSDLVLLNRELIGNDKENKLLESDVFIQTSRSEGMPLGILEAMSYGVPCIVTEGTCLDKDVKEYNCGWSSETNSKDISNKIIECLNDKDIYLEKGRNAKKLIEEKYTWDVVSKNTVSSYKKIIGYEDVTC